MRPLSAFKFFRFRTMGKLSLILVTFVLTLVVMLFVASLLLKHNVSISQASLFFKSHILGFFMVRVFVIALISLACSSYVRRKINATEQNEKEEISDERSQKIKSLLGNPLIWFAGIFCVDILLQLPVWLS